MTLPKAAVTITLQTITGIDALLAGAKRPYALGTIGPRRFGRSRPIPAGAAELDLTAEAVPWKLEVAATGQVRVAVEIWDDQGDLGPKLLGAASGNVDAPYPTKVHEIGAGPKLRCDVFAREVPSMPSAALVPRVAEGQPTRATLRVPNSVVVTITDVEGLYAPTAPGASGAKRAEAKPGYTSEDNLGRVYLNTDLKRAWKKDTQLIKLTAKVTVQRGKLPADAKIKWTVTEPDDPTDDDPGFHVEWGRYVDKNDYDAAGTPKGARGADNEGKPAKSPPWEAVSGFALSSSAKTEAKTTIVGDESKVVFHCPDTAGDNFVVRADLDTATKAESFGAQTGVITLWHRIDVEVVRMKGAFALPMDDVPVPFEPCCVQLDCQPEREVPDKQYMAPKDDDLETESSTYVDSVFTNKSKPGWFCVISAMEPHPLPAKKGDKVFEGQTELKDGGSGANLFENFEVPGTFPDANFAEITSGGETVGFNLFSIETETTKAGPITRCWIVPHDCQPEFTAGDGSLKHAYAVRYHYSPRNRKKGGAVTAGGYGMTKKVDVKVFNPGAFYTAGISPTVSDGKKDYFAGRTIMYTHHGAYRDEKTSKPKATYHERILGTIVHELVHAFGMPHKCGYFDFRAPRSKTCCMNYRPNWMVDDKRNLLKGTSAKTGMDVCGRHLKEVRRVHLEDNKGLAWK